MITKIRYQESVISQLEHEALFHIRETTVQGREDKELLICLAFVVIGSGVVGEEAMPIEASAAPTESHTAQP